MRVIMANRLFGGYLGGVEQYIASLSAELRRLGADVTICAARGRASLYVDGIRVETVASISELRQFIVRHKPDVVHGFGAREPFCFAALRFARQAGARTVFTPHAMNSPEVGAMGPVALLADLARARYATGFCDAVMNVTAQDQALDVRRGRAQKATLIPISVSARELQALEARHRGADFPVRGPYILHVGRFDRMKNIEFLVRAHRGLPDLSLVLIGQDGGTLDGVRALVAELGLEDRVHVFEPVDRSRMVAAFANAALVAQSSTWEGLSTVVIEGLFFRKPFVSTDVGCNGWLVQRGAPGFLFPHDDEATYGTQVRRALDVSMPALEAARNLVRSDLCWEVNAARVLDLYSGARAAAEAAE